MSRYADTTTGDALRHLDSIADTGTSHTLHPRQYVVRCEWCPHVFFGPTKAEAMRQFRLHEDERIDTANAARRSTRGPNPTSDETRRQALRDQLDAEEAQT